LKTQLANETETATEDKTSEGGKFIEGAEKTSVYNNESGGFATADSGGGSPYAGAGSPPGGKTAYSEGLTNNPYSNSEGETSKYSKPEKLTRLLSTDDFKRFGTTPNKVDDNELKVGNFYHLSTSKTPSTTNVHIEVIDPDDVSAGTVISTQATYWKTDPSKNAGKYVHRYTPPRNEILPIEWMGKRLKFRFYKDIAKSKKISALEDTIHVPNTPGDVAIRQEVVTYYKRIVGGHADMKKHYFALLATPGNTFFNDIISVANANNNVTTSEIPKLKSDLQKNTDTKTLLTNLESKYNADFNPDTVWNNMSKGAQDAVTNQNKTKLSLTYHWLWGAKGQKTVEFTKAEQIKKVFEGKDYFYNPSIRNSAIQQKIDVPTTITDLTNKELAIDKQFGKIETDSKANVAAIKNEEPKNSELKKAFLKIIIKLYEGRTQNLAAPKKGATAPPAKQVDAIGKLDLKLREKGVAYTPLEVLKGITPQEIVKIQGLIGKAETQYITEFGAIDALFADASQLTGKKKMTKPGPGGRTRFNTTTRSYFMRFGKMKDKNNFHFSKNEIEVAETVGQEYNRFKELKSVFDQIVINGTGPTQTISIKAYKPKAPNKTTVGARYDHRSLGTYNKALNPTDIDPSNVDQHLLGTCWLLGTTAAIAEHDPTKLLGQPDAVLKQVGKQIEVQLWTQVANGTGTTLTRITVLVDPEFLTKTPVDLQGVEGKSEYQFAQTGTNNSGRFMQTIEKAVAQLYGSYAGAELKPGSTALEHLLGKPSKLYQLGNLSTPVAGVTATIDTAIQYINAYKTATGRMPLVLAGTPDYSALSLNQSFTPPPSGELYKSLPKKTVGATNLKARVIYGQHLYEVSDIVNNQIFKFRNPHNDPARTFADAGAVTLRMSKAEVDAEFSELTIYDEAMQDAFFNTGAPIPKKGS
jgi:hypothetical protein